MICSRAQEDEMTDISNRVAFRENIVDIAGRASLYAVLLSALTHQKRFQPLPLRLYEDLNIPPSERPDLTPRLR
jgi:hypothetical protein